MDCSGLAHPPSVFQEWVAAVRGIKDNPLLNLFESRTTKTLLINWAAAARVAGWVIGGLLLAIWLLYGLTKRVTSNPATYSTFVEPVIGPWLIIIIIGGLYVALWFAVPLYLALRDACSVLSQRGSRLSYFQLDEHVALSGLTAAEIICAVAYLCLSRLLRPLLAMCGITAAVYLCAVRELSAGPQSEFAMGFYAYSLQDFNPILALAAAPLTFLCLLTTSLLATLALLLACIALGRNLSLLQAHVASAVHVLSHLIWLSCFVGYGAKLAWDANSVSYEYQNLTQHAFTPGTAGLGSVLMIAVVVAYALVLSAAQRLRQLRSAALFAPPAILLLLVISIATVWFASASASVGPSTFRMLGEGMYACGLLQCWHPLLIPGALALGMAGGQAGLLPLFEWYRWPLVLLLLLGLVWVAAGQARRAVLLQLQQEE